MAVRPAPPIVWGGDPPQSLTVLKGEATPQPIASSLTFVPAPTITPPGGGGGTDDGAGYPITG
jgi:hypothetical protein